MERRAVPASSRTGLAVLRTGRMVSRTGLAVLRTGPMVSRTGLTVCRAVLVPSVSRTDPTKLPA
ncbi:hypothetical protein BJY18_000308 [Amycolatopsis jiangsuensis]|uniref:Uncharacterized protein n=1 Tax=Amycolatopsis jiangsuensis TaxID=1181879 RepID=A0A840ILK8_9PSEU|nr:hypothetical protein [Amycolatopsis jiangsuensis]